MSEHKPIFGQADRSSRRSLVIAAVLGLIVIGVVVYWLFLQPKPSETPLTLPIPEPVTAPLSTEIIEQEPTDQEPVEQGSAVQAPGTGESAVPPTSRRQPTGTPSQKPAASSKSTAPKSASRPATRAATAPRSAPTGATTGKAAAGTADTRTKSSTAATARPDTSASATGGDVEVTPLPSRPKVTTHEERLAGQTRDAASAAVKDDSPAATEDGYVLRAFPDSASGGTDATTAPAGRTAEGADVRKPAADAVAGQTGTEPGAAVAAAPPAAAVAQTSGSVDGSAAADAAEPEVQAEVQAAVAEIEHLGPLFEEERITLRHLVRERIRLAADVARTTREFAPVDIAFDNVSPEDPVYTNIASEREARWVTMMETTEDLQRVERALRIYREEVRQRRLLRPDWPN